MSYTAPNIPPKKHLFFNRHGGSSEGKYASLNFSWGSQDKKENILKNIEIVAQHFHLPSSSITILNQKVSNNSIIIEKPSLFQIYADGMATNKSNIILAVRTADCAPILFYDSVNHVIGAAHTGWRGALRGIIENTVNQMLTLGAEKKHIAAAIGPCLQKKSFECRNDMLQEFLAQNKSYEDFFEHKGTEHWLFDAEQFCIHRLQNCGITNISASGIDTYTDTDYFSYRRNCHQNLISAPLDYPSHLSTITL